MLRNCETWSALVWRTHSQPEEAWNEKSVLQLQARDQFYACLDQEGIAPGASGQEVVTSTKRRTPSNCQKLRVEYTTSCHASWVRNTLLPGMLLSLLGYPPQWVWKLKAHCVFELYPNKDSLKRRKMGQAPFLDALNQVTFYCASQGRWMDDWGQLDAPLSLTWLGCLAHSLDACCLLTSCVDPLFVFVLVHWMLLQVRHFDRVALEKQQVRYLVHMQPQRWSKMHMQPQRWSKLHLELKPCGCGYQWVILIPRISTYVA